MYGVLVCPRCNRAKGVDLKQKTTTCVCGREIRVSGRRIQGRADTARDLAPLVGRLNAQLAGGLAAYERDAAPKKRRRIQDVHARVVAGIPRHVDRASRIRAAATGLSRELELFTRDDWNKVLAGLGIPDPETALDALVRANAVFEPKAGFYRSVGFTG